MISSYVRQLAPSRRAVVSVQGSELQADLGEMLASDGWHVVHAETGALLEAELASWLLWGGTAPADVLVLDARTHSLEGLHLLRALDRVGRGIPAVVVGCGADEREQAAGLPNVIALRGSEPADVWTCVRELMGDMEVPLARAG